MTTKHNSELDVFNDENNNKGVKTVYDRIKELCDAHDMSIVMLEKALGFSRSYLFKWKTSCPSADKLALVADYFGVSLDYLYSGKVEGDIELDSDIISIQRARRNMPEKDRKRMMEMLHIAFEEAFKNGDISEQE